MLSSIQQLVQHLIQSEVFPATSVLDLKPLFKIEEAESGGRFHRINAAFLILLAGEQHPQFTAAKDYLEKRKDSPDWGQYVEFYLAGIDRIRQELDQVCGQRETVKQRLAEMATHLSEAVEITRDRLAEITWAGLFPEGAGIRGQEEAKIAELRENRRVTITQLNPTPIDNPAQQILFSSNVLLTVPLPSTPIETLDFGDEFKSQLTATAQEPQLYWYDHPIPIGTSPESNEILYGLKALNQAIAFEHTRPTKPSQPVTCLLSVSVTHQGLQSLGKDYLKQVLSTESLEHLKIVAFTEADTDALIQRVLLPAIERYCPTENAAELLNVFGVDGRYGRHYSFLKAIAGLWSVLIDPEVKATFKIDLDQVFPQAELIEQTGASAFEHFQTPLWGAQGTNAKGQPLELGMIAGALVNQKDIAKGVFTPDVAFPNRDLKPDEFVFFSTLPQALSTVAEMMTRYDDSSGFDGQTTCLQRIHVTGGTNGILVDSLQRHRPFTPSFIARAEDQAYILSTFPKSSPSLGYAHASGLIMRHDKEGFAQEAIQMAKVGKLIGDYVRILVFSAYAQQLAADLSPVKTAIDPFTGCFISELPVTIVYLRFALKAATLFAEGSTQDAAEFLRLGIPQIQETLAFIQGQSSGLQQTYEQERQGWMLYYDALAALTTALQAGDATAMALQTEAKAILEACVVS